MSSSPDNSVSKAGIDQLDDILIKETRLPSPVGKIVNSIGVFLIILFVFLSLSLVRVLSTSDSYSTVEIAIQIAAYVWMLVGGILLWMRNRAGYFLVTGFFTYTITAIVWSLFKDQRMAFGSTLMDVIATLFPFVMLGLMSLLTRLMFVRRMRETYRITYRQYWISLGIGVLLYVLRGLFVF